MDGFFDKKKYVWDLKNVIDTAREEGKIEERFTIAERMKKEGFSNEKIKKHIGLTAEEIEKL